MKKYIKNYLKANGYDEGEFIHCEVCGKPATDIHHIIFRGQGGSDEADNLIALDRECHDKAHFKQEPYLKAKTLFKIKGLN